jgi:multidrug efflux pump subunit AcrA (membrane-fusion protein)
MKKRVFLCSLVLLFGLGGMAGLASLKEPPAEVRPEERALRVTACRMQPADYPVTITGYGEVRALNEVSITPEVAGRVVEVHPRLETGEVVAAGELLFRLDSRNYAAAFDEARASVDQLANAVLRLKRQQEIDIRRLKNLERNRDLAKEAFLRLRSLFEQDAVGTRTGVEQAEQAFNAAQDQLDQMAQAVALYPIRIRESEGALASARARMARARADLERCRVEAPFSGRLSAVAIEAGQLATPGQAALTLVDDSVLEIHVPLDSRDASRWLRFNGTVENGGAWFAGLVPVDCKVSWTEGGDGSHWSGKMDRVVRFDPKTRTLTVAVRLTAADIGSQAPAGGLPLVEGMFCAVSIPGKTLSGAYRLPRWAVSFDNTVYKAVDNRLKTEPVSVARVDEEGAYINGGIEPGDVVLITRLVDPLENTLLSITYPEGDDQ